ncbi:alkaline phosphatase D family protein [Robiginitomaculum antarcticum]|uniref:alkaline phosphatase D family protein n=1 Tax=Robiginitomaculum antarcticum TaxID=437507 RepID=UPI000526B2B9|nr:alkaline phosphatase D family protein [Robiginitomaculum antarcticum]
MSDKLLNTKRRTVLKAGVSGGISALVMGQTSYAHEEPSHALETLLLPTSRERPWISSDFWSNRFQDWQLKNGIAECLNGDKGHEVRTLGLLTHDVQADGDKIHLEAIFTPLTNQDAKGFAGFLVGVGQGRLDYRAAALAQRGSGENGGFMAIVDTNGRVAFRDHASDAVKITYEEWDAKETDQSRTTFVKTGVKLVLKASRKGSRYDLLLTALHPKTDQPISYARRTGVNENELLGAISLLSSPEVAKVGARWSIKDIKVGGDKLAAHPERALGPIMGTMHSLTGNVLKLSAQFMPLGKGDPEKARLQYREPAGTKWKTVGTSPILDGYSALFRDDEWDSSKDWDFRVTFAGINETLWSGTVKKDPGKDKDLVAALYSCISSTANSLEGGPIKSQLPTARSLGRFTPENFYFPHNEIRKNTMAHDPDILMVCGDQYYEHNPIRLGRSNVETRKIDTLYRWYLWYWSFREVTRSTPTIMLLDDHDVLHGNIWGHAGRAAPNNSQNHGGYAYGIDLTLMVHRIQASHNPDAFDPTPVLNDIPVMYSAFMYGGVSIAVVEDRKWKTTPMFGDNLDVHVSELLGERQETFLKEWKDMHPGAPKMLVTASVWGCPQTSPTGEPVTDFDSNGYPPLPRRRAVKLVKDVGAVMVAGDQHLATVVRLGIDDFEDGPIQFSGPAGGAYWQRWFDPITPLPNARKGVKESGDFIDGFGNKMNIKAVANPKLTFAEFRKYRKGRGQSVSDPALKTEGYGIIRVSHSDQSFTFESWDKSEDITKSKPKQMSGWPYRVGFDEV